MNSRFKFFVLAKNEASNIEACLEALEKLSVPVTVLLDSSATDATDRIASRYQFVELIRYEYRGHCTAYNEISTWLAVGADFCVVLDADMVVTEELFSEIEDRAGQPATEVVVAPVLMHAEGKPLRFGSNYPPKPIAFKVGREYFFALGHGEVLMADCVVRKTRAKLVHDDRKAYGVYLETQYRYSEALIGRAKHGSLGWKDLLRLRTPIMLVVTPVVSYFVRLGFLSGKAAMIYALDRLIAEAVMFRQALAARLRDRNGS